MSDKVIIGEHELDAILALTEEEHENGLMWVKEPVPVMVFVFNTVEPRKFWMHNTIAPLDIIHCINDKILSISDGKPMSEDMIGPEDPVNMVVEMPAGMSKKLNIKPGDPVKVNYSMKSIAKKIEINLKK